MQERCTGAHFIKTNGIYNCLFMSASSIHCINETTFNPHKTTTSGAIYCIVQFTTKVCLLVIGFTFLSVKSFFFTKTMHTQNRLFFCAKSSPVHSRKMPKKWVLGICEMSFGTLWNEFLPFSKPIWPIFTKMLNFSSNFPSKMEFYVQFLGILN